METGGADKLPNRILGWLASHGYPMELRVANTFRAHGWMVEHAYYYLDPETGKQRECDLRCGLTSKAPGAEPRATFHFAVECKQSRDKPWVVFATKTGAPWYFFAGAYATGQLSGYALATVAAKHKDLVEFLKPVDWVGHGITRALVDKSDGDPASAYSALRAAVTASTALALRDESTFEGLRKTVVWPTIVVPLVVVDAPLFRYHLDAESSQEILTPIESISVLTPHSGSAALIYTTVVTSEGLSKYLDQISPRVLTLCAFIAEDAPLIQKLFDARQKLAPAGE